MGSAYRHTLTAFGGIAALDVGGALPLADGSTVFVPVIGVVGGIAAMALANHERLKQRMDALERRLAQAEWRGGFSGRRPGQCPDELIGGAVALGIGDPVIGGGEFKSFEALHSVVIKRAMILR